MKYCSDIDYVISYVIYIWIKLDLKFRSDLAASVHTSCEQTI